MSKLYVRNDADLVAVRHGCTFTGWSIKRWFEVHSEWKNRSIFLTPQKWLFWHKLSSMDLRECILAIFGSPGPLGGVKGGMGGSGGVPGTKNCNFFGSHIWVTNWEILDCMNWKHSIFQVFGQKWLVMWPLKTTARGAEFWWRWFQK